MHGLNSCEAVLLSWSFKKRWCGHAVLDPHPAADPSCGYGMGHGALERWWGILLLTCWDAGAGPILSDVNSAPQLWGFYAHSYKLWRCPEGNFTEGQVTEPSSLTQTCLVHLWALTLESQVVTLVPIWQMRWSLLLCPCTKMLRPILGLLCLNL